MSNQQKQRRQSRHQAVSRQDIEAIIDGNVDKLVAVAKELGTDLKNQKLSTSQIRNIFGTVRRIEAIWPMHGSVPGDAEHGYRELVLLKPKMAYQAKRINNSAVRNLTAILTQAIDCVGSDRTKFQRFAEFFEAILAYHKAAGGS